MSLYFLFIVFFFKQKTAYEMRISDWSSDVCSSDLPQLRRLLAHGAGARHGHGAGADAPARRRGGAVVTTAQQLPRKVVLAAGGTGGHMFPAEALADRKSTRLNSSH